jgi:hypothetical protein
MATVVFHKSDVIMHASSDPRCVSMQVRLTAQARHKPQKTMVSNAYAPVCRSMDVYIHISYSKLYFQALLYEHY